MNSQTKEKMKEKEWKEEHKTKEAKTFTLALRRAACGPFLPGQHISFPATTSARPLFLSRRPISTPIGGIIKRKTEPSAGHIRKCAVGSKTESSNQQYLFLFFTGGSRDNLEQKIKENYRDDAAYAFPSLNGSADGYGKYNRRRIISIVSSAGRCIAGGSRRFKAPNNGEIERNKKRIRTPPAE